MSNSSIPLHETLEADIRVDQEDCNLIIISDLHLGEGYLQSRRAYARAERFFSDEAFKNFLQKIHNENLQAADGAPPKPLKLIINGDFLDFARTKSVPDEHERRIFYRYFRRLGLMRQQDDFEIQPHESKYGLKPEQHKSVWKLHRICQGHPLVFEALAEFVARGNRLVIIKGNHDLEFYWPAVQDEFIKILAAMWPAGSDRPRSPRQRHRQICAKVEFCQRAYIVENQIYIEHGHQYQPITRVEKALLNEHELCLPPGSILSRYLVNAIDHLAPFVTYIRGTFEVARALVTGHRWRALRLLMRHFPIATKMLLRGYRGVAFTLFVEVFPYLFAVLYASFGIFLPLVWQAYSRALIEFTGPAGEFLISRWFLNFTLGIGLFGLFCFLARLSGRNLTFRFKEAFATAKARMQQMAGMKDGFGPVDEGEAYGLTDKLQRAQQRVKEMFTPGIANTTVGGRYRAFMRRAQQKMKKFIILGHTHQPAVQPLDDTWWYINTGAWVPVIERGHNPIHAKITLTYALFMRRANGAFDFDLRCWNDDKGRSERLVVWESA
jgi:UDP-2,3-diacylglucosamine pyrophosphatase LpxH